MKVMMVGQHVNFFRNLDSVMRELCRRGHNVVFLHGTRLDDARVSRKLAQDSKKRMLGRGLQVAQSEIAGVTSGYRPEPGEAWPLRLRTGGARGIPNIGYVNSWDNLTSKGMVHVLQDVYIVWNEPIAQEAVEIHEIPARTVRITGAPHLDTFFTLRPRRTR